MFRFAGKGLHCSAVVMHSFSRKSIVSAAAAAADGHAGGDTNGWKHDNLECRPLNSTIACSPVACSSLICSPLVCSPFPCFEMVYFIKSAAKV